MPFLSALVLVAGLLQGSEAQKTFDDLRYAVGSGNEARVQSFFVRKSDASYLLEMAERQGGLRGIKVSMIPSPPGWEQHGPYWAIFHTVQDIESDHDAVYPVIRTGNGFRLGREISEGTPQSVRIKHLATRVKLDPPQGRADVSAQADLQAWSGSGAPVFRVNDNYIFRTPQVDGHEAPIVLAGDKLPSPIRGDVVRAGSLAIVWQPTPPKSVRFSYSGTVRVPGADKVTTSVAYLTAWWTPSIARLPHTSEVTVVAPRAWHVVSEGTRLPDPAAVGGDEEATTVFRCDVPISYPKVVAGMYKLAHEQQDVNGRWFRAYHLDPVDPERGKRDVGKMLAAVGFFEDHLGPFPFPGYACYDADTYYGIESYSYTLLRRSITTQFVTHEMAHTYFGGLAPSAYVKDSWNEGVTQYVDSVALGKNADGTLQRALQTLNVPMPLTKMPVTHLYNSATYWRGAYVMKMLEAEMGQEKVLSALAQVVKGQVDKETTWASLLPYFERVHGKKLDWFWAQWIENAEFPLLTIKSAQLIEREGKYSTFVTVAQSETYTPYRLRFKVRVRSTAGVLGEKDVELVGNQDSFRIDTDTKPTQASLEVFPLTLARVAGTAPVKP